MKIYSCDKCGFETGWRKKIRQHVREEHGVPPGERNDDGKSVITASYTAREWKG